MKVPEGFERVYVSNGPLRAEAVRALLEANGIPALIQYSALGRALGATFDGLGEVEVWVRAEDAVAARDLLAASALPEDSPEGP